MPDTAFSLTTKDLHAIPTRHWPCDNPKGVIHILHGMAEHCKRYRYTATQFNAAGYTVVAHDHRGHGLSIGPSAPQGHFADNNGWSKVVDDVHLVNQWIKQQYPMLPIILLGHSMGSFIALSYTCQYGSNIQALMLSGSNLTPPHLVLGAKALASTVATLFGRRSYSWLIDKATFGHYNHQFQPTRTEFDWLSRDTRAVDDYIDDPLCGFLCSTRLWQDLSGALSQLGKVTTLENIPHELPVYCFSGELDPLSYSNKKHRILQLVALLQRSGVEHVSYKLYPGGRHEALNEINKDDVTNDCLAWLSKALD